MADAPFPSIGVSSAFLVAWKDDLIAQGKITATSTATEVCDLIVKPATLGLNQSFADTLSSPSTGEATHFVSHAWKYYFVDLVAAIEIHVLTQRDGDVPMYFWIDLFVVDQHNAPHRPHSWWSTTFVSAIEKMGRVVMVFSPLLDPVPLTRAWCLWEIYSAIKAKALVSLAMPTEQWTNFRVNLREDYHKVLQMLQDIDARRADAFNINDKNAIFNAIETMAGGFDALNGHVRKLIAGILLVGAVPFTCEDSKLSRLQDLLVLEPDINVVSPFLTPLGVACDLNSPLLVDFFLARGANVNFSMGWGHTPLHIACRGGHPDIVRMLLMSNADTSLRNNKGRTPLDEAKEASANRGVQASAPPTEAAAIEVDSAKLEQVLVAQNAARNALNSLGKCDVVELKSFKNPPQVTLVTIKCMVLILKLAPHRLPKEDNEYWEIGKRKILSDVDFLYSLTSTDFLPILSSTEPPILQVMEHANDPLLDSEAAKKVSRVTWAFCLWVRVYILAHSLRQNTNSASYKERLAADSIEANAIQQDHIKRCCECIAILEAHATQPPPT